MIRALPRDITVVLIEHDMDVALGLADRVTVMHRGRVMAEGTPEDVQANPKSATCISAMSEPQPETSEPLLSVSEIHTYYGDSYVLQGVSLTLHKGRIAAILGRNGMGKTTLIRSVAGLTPPRTGEIVYRGRSLRGKPPYAIAQDGIAIVPQGRRIFRSLSVRENLLLPTSVLARSQRPPAGGEAAAALGFRRGARRSFRSWPSASTIPAARSAAASSRCWRSAARSWPIPS